jgi:hypothetical protein
VGFLLWPRQAPTPTVTTLEKTTVPTRSGPRRPPPESRLGFLRDTTQPWQVRVERLRDLFADGGCAEHELLELYALLAAGAPATEIPEHGYVLANDLMTQLTQRDPDRQRFANQLTQILQDPKQPSVIRDYCVQYLASMIRPQLQTTLLPLPAPTPEVVTQVLNALVAATLQPQNQPSTIPGTTLMMLVSLAHSGEAETIRPAIDKLKPWLADALNGTANLALPVRVSAIQAAGLLAPIEFRPLVRQLAFGDGQNLAIRLPSIAALGQCGELSDLPQLATVVSHFPDLSYAVQDARLAITTRFTPATAPSP